MTSMRILINEYEIATFLEKGISGVFVPCGDEYALHIQGEEFGIVAENIYQEYGDQFRETAERLVYLEEHPEEGCVSTYFDRYVWLDLYLALMTAGTEDDDFYLSP